MPRSSILAAVLLAVIPVVGCSSGDGGRSPAETISRDAFIKAYIELRLESQRHMDHEIPLEERDRILESLDLTPEDLLEFVEVHGGDPDFMHELWAEVDEKLREARLGPRTEPGGESARPPGGGPSP